MPLTPEQKQELVELRRLDELEQKFGNKAAPQEPTMLQKIGKAFMRSLARDGSEYPPEALVGLTEEDRARTLRDWDAEAPLRNLMLSVTPPVGALAGVAKFLAGSALGRITAGAVVGAGQGAIEKPKDDETRLGNAGMGALKGGAIATGAEGLSALAGGAGRAWDTVKKGFQIRSGSPALNQEAQGAMSEAAKYLRNRPERDQLAELLKGKNAELNPDEFMGHSPEADNILTKAKTNAVGGNPSDYFQKVTAGTPSQVQVPLEDLNKARQSIDSNLPWKKAGYGTLSESVMDQGRRGAAAANKMRELVNGASPDIADASEAVHKGIKGAEMLEKGAERPVSFLTNKNPDARAQIAEILGNAGDKGAEVKDLADVLRSAKTAARHPITHGPLEVGYQGLKGSAKSLSGPASLSNNPATIKMLLDALSNKESVK